MNYHTLIGDNPRHLVKKFGEFGIRPCSLKILENEGFGEILF